MATKRVKYYKPTKQFLAHRYGCSVWSLLEDGIKIAVAGDPVFVNSRCLWDKSYKGFYLPDDQIVEFDNSERKFTGYCPYLWYLGQPAFDVAFDSSGNVYVAHQSYTSGSSNITKLNSFGEVIWNYATGGVGCMGIAVDGWGNVYATGYRYDSKSVWKLSSS